MAKAEQTEGIAEINEPQRTFSLDPRADQSLQQLAEAGQFDDIHFFISEALDGEMIDDQPADEDTTFALIPYEHPADCIDDSTWELLADEGYEQATFRDLLNFAIEHPGAQKEFDILALGTIRTRRVYEDTEGETVWDQTERDKSICQWATGLSNLSAARTLVPMEIYLDKVLRKDAMILVRK